jgi:hypothetical protein
MPTSKPKESHNADASPMTYDVTFIPSFQQQRNRLAMEAESMSMTDLKAAAAEAQIDTSGVKSKDALVSTVKDAARTIA